MSDNITCFAAILPTLTPQLMTTATIFIRNHKSELVKCRTLLDTCATANFISEKLAKDLNLPMTSCTLPVDAINSMNTMSRGIIRFTIQSLHNEYCKELTALLIPTIADFVPSEMFSRHSIKIPRNIKLADPEFHIPRPIDLLIGAGTTLSLFLIGQINLSRKDHDLYLQKTRLGWIIAGGGESIKHKANVCLLTNLEKQSTKFWTVEEIMNDAPRSTNEFDCEMHFAENVTRNNTGRYVVRLPFSQDSKRLRESYNIALKRLHSFERKFKSDPELKFAYSQVIQEYLHLEQMYPVDDPTDNGFYMPHHAVIKAASNTTKVRVVFDVSAKTSNGISLNNVLLVGPTIQNSIFAHLLRFRTYRYVLTADISTRQILVHEDDHKYQRILWRQNDQIKTFQLNTLTFGVSSSPYLAIRTIHQLADDECHEYPEASRVLKTHLYVDDLLTGSNTINDTRKLRNELRTVLSRDGFNIRQWASNDNRIIIDLDESAVNSNLIIDKNNYLKTLGISWHARDDTLRYSVHPINYTERITKRSILSDIAKIFDPLGILGPIILYAKKLMQELWQCKLNWDESIPPSIHIVWTEFATQLNLINDLAVTRPILISDHTDIQIHGFCDASNVGYGACIYIRSSDLYNNIHCHLLCAKSRVAPLKTLTIPRLELCGALLLAKLYREIRDTIEIPFNKVILWSDSTIVLHWVKTSPHILKPYVAHRIAQIQELTCLATR
ncbi:uncharacterized protein [Linepithema humile]|uniref:uncharacterized protein n=1 Tax=Linepithema humile TaxID=83485 RepID=UPI00351F1BB9